MVKVQKPIPKTFDKIDTKSHNSIKKKKDKLKHKAVTVSSQAVASSSKTKQKVKLIKGIKDSEVLTTKKEKVGQPERKRKEKKRTTSEGPSNDDVTSRKKTIHKENIVHQKSSNSLSPPPPPTPLLPTFDTDATLKISSKKEKKKERKIKDKSKEKRTSTAPTESVKKNIKNKKGKLKSKVCEEETDNDVKEKHKHPVDLIQNTKKLASKNKKQETKAEKWRKEKGNVDASFDEDKFNAIVHLENIKKIAKALKTQVEQEVAKKKNVIFSDYRYFLNVTSFKIPNCPKRMVKLNLKHSLVDKNDDVAIIVPDLKRGAKIDYEPTIEHYEELFRQAGVEGLKVIPFNQLKKECQSFEAVRKFSNRYDYFLCDGRIVSHVVGFCGKIFQKPRTTFHSVRLGNTQNLKREIEKSLRRTAYKQLEKGNLIAIPVGNHKYTMQQLAENIDVVLKQLKTIFPGGLANVRNINLRIDIVGTSALPIYISMDKAPSTTPYVVGPREERMLKLKRKANEVLTNFALTKEGNLLKLSKGQIEKKRKIKEVRDALLAKSEEGAENNDGEESAAPKKKALKDGRDDITESKKKNSDNQVEPKDDGGEDPGEGSDEEGGDDSESDENENDGDDDDVDDDEDDEENADVNEGGDDDDDDENEDDEDGDDDDNEDDDDDDDDDDD